MLFQTILNALKGLLQTLLGWINIPSAGEEFSNGISYFTTMLETGQSLIDLFIPWSLVKFGLPLLIVVVNFERVYNLIMWILRKIPMLGIE